MRFPLALPLLLASLGLGAQEVVTLNQGLSMALWASRASGGGATSLASGLQTDYRVDVGMPIVTYRLGTLSVGGNLNGTWQKDYGRQDSALSLNTIGASGSLFPYQPFHFSFDYTHNASPDLFGGGKVTSNILGLGFAYQGRYIQSLHLDYRHGSTSGATDGEFTSYSLRENQRFGDTDLQILGDRMEYTSAGVPWTYTNLFASTYSPLTQGWLLLNNLRFNTSLAGRQNQFSSVLMGSAVGWTSVSSVDASQGTSNGWTDRTLGFNQSLARTWGRLSAYTQAGTAEATSGDGGSSRATHLTLGAVYKLTPSWSVVGDASKGWVGHTDGQGAALNTGAGPARTLHVGVNWGGELPDQLRHLMFYWTNLQFQRRLNEDYPPGYLPQEMVQVLAARRRYQDGPMAFSTDLYRIDNNLGHQLWYRTRGSLNLRMGLMIMILGDLRKEVNFSGGKDQVEFRDLNLYGSQRLGWGSLSFGYAHSSNYLDPLPDGPQSPAPTNVGSISSSTTTYTLGANTFLGGVPVGTYAVRSIDALGAVTNQLAAYSDAGYGRVRFRITFQHGWRSNGTQGSQLTINLLRTFDTIALWGSDD